MDKELFFKVSEREKGMGGIETFLIFPMAALNFAVVSGGIRTDELVTNAQVSSSFLEKSQGVTLAVGKTVSKLKTVVGLDAFNMDAPSSIPLD